MIDLRLRQPMLSCAWELVIMKEVLSVVLQPMSFDLYRLAKVHDNIGPIDNFLVLVSFHTLFQRFSQLTLEANDETSD